MEKTSEGVRKPAGTEEVIKKCKRGRFLAYEYAEHEFLVRSHPFFPFVQCGDRDAKILTDIYNGCIPFEICDEYGEDKAQTVRAVGNDDVRK